MSEQVTAFAAELGEGPLWHPVRGQLFWFDIIGKKLLCDDGQQWDFDEHVSATGWISETELLIASETELFRFELKTGTKSHVAPLEPENEATRSNDGRADPWGGFWIGTMGKNAEPGEGAIYRYFDGELRQLFAPITISNAICFAPDRSAAYFTDTVQKIIFRVTLDNTDGWPNGDPSPVIDLTETGENPDGAVTCADGSILVALWGSSCIAHFTSDGSEIERFAFDAPQMSCPALGGPHLTTLFATSARQGMSDAERSQMPLAGRTFKLETHLKGLPEYQVKL